MCSSKRPRASHTHEAVTELLCDSPLFVRDLLHQCLQVALPDFAAVDRADSKLTDLIVHEIRIDGVLVFQDAAGEAVTQLGIEVQLQPDPDKQYTWPAYVVLTRARHRCPTDLLVVTLDEATAAWAEQAIHLGTLNSFRAYVLGPKQIPRVESRQEAAVRPELAVLSALAHCRKPEDAPLVRAVLDGLTDVENGRAAYYRDVILQSLTVAMQELVEELMPYPGYEPQSDYSKGVFQGLAKGRLEGKAEGKAEGKVEGEIEGLAKALLSILSVRGIAVSTTQRLRIESADAKTLAEWVQRAVTIQSADELLGPTQ